MKQQEVKQNNLRPYSLGVVVECNATPMDIDRSIPFTNLLYNRRPRVTYTAIAINSCNLLENCWNRDNLALYLAPRASWT